MINAKTQKEIRAIIDAYFNDIPHRVTITMAGTIADAEIIYTDFKPKRQVRRELEELIPNLDECTLIREYSPEVESDAIDIANTNYPTIYIKNKERGDFVPTSISVLIDEILMGRTIA